MRREALMRLRRRSRESEVEVIMEKGHDVRLALITHPDCLKHDPGPHHVERPTRLEALLDALEGDGELMGLAEKVTAREASEEELAMVHSVEHVRWVGDRCRSGPAVLDADDTFVVEESYRAALLAAGAVLDAVDRTAADPGARCFCAVRPPGHHAEHAASMGFCLFNNVAVGARYAQGAGMERVAIVDFDVHHGNGTERSFYQDGTVLYVSLHQHPHYPGTGAAEDIGEGPGKGANLNVPLPAGSGEPQYMAAVESMIIPALKAFAPELLMFSAGFDAHEADPLSGILLTEGTYHDMTRTIMEACEPTTLGRTISVLEGGYRLESLAASAKAHVRALAGLGR